MIRVPCWKIVRDKEAEHFLEEPSENIIVKKIDREELEKLILIKLVEDSVKLAEEPSLENAADLVGSLEEWLSLRGTSIEKLLEIARDKRDREGRYSGYIVVWIDRDSC